MAAFFEIRASRKTVDLLDGTFAREFAEFAQRALTEAAARATNMTRAVYQDQLKGREPAAPRKGRPTTLGQFPRYLQWTPSRENGVDQVAFDYAEIDAKAPYWIIQEVGTGRSFKILGSSTNGYSGQIPSQRGRGIPFGLQWGVGGAYVPPGGFDGAQLQPVSTLKAEGRSVYAMRIRKEIEGKHFVRLGGQEGFRFYENALGSEFRRIFQ